MTELIEAALGYAGRNWPVFPCEVRGKRPLGRLVTHGLKDATTDPDVIRGWWEAEPEANIALVTGVKFDVLDIDGDDGWSTLAHTVAQFGCLSSSPVSMTGAKGGHDLFLPTGGGNRAGFLPNLDWRGRGGYIVAPPSVHPNGTRYEWALSPDEVPLEAAPPWLVGLVNRHRNVTGLLSQGGVPTPLNGDGSAYARRALEGECGRVALAPVGARNDTLNSAAFNLGQLVGGRMITAAEAGPALLQVAMGIGLSESEATATIESGLRSGIAHPRRVKS